MGLYLTLGAHFDGSGKPTDWKDGVYKKPCKHSRFIHPRSLTAKTPEKWPSWSNYHFRGAVFKLRGCKRLHTSLKPTYLRIFTIWTGAGFLPSTVFGGSNTDPHVRLWLECRGFVQFSKMQKLRNFWISSPLGSWVRGKEGASNL